MRSSPFCFVAIGGSITTGYAAPVPQEGGWAALVAQGLKESKGELEYRNRGVSGTDSAWASLRIAEHAAGADLVVLEFAINDQWLDPSLRRQSYEGVLRQVLCLPSRPRILCLFLHERGDFERGQGREQRVIAEHYGVAWVAPNLTGRSDAWNPEDPIHPNAVGHRLIASAVLGALGTVFENPTSAPADPRDLRDPLYSSDWQYVRTWDSTTAKALGRGWREGSDVHHEWQAHGGALTGWSTTEDEAELSVEVEGRTVGVLYSESEHYRDLVARLDAPGAGDEVTLEAHRADRRGYLGWAYRALGRGLGAGPHTATVRFAEAGRGSGRAGHVVAFLGTGVWDASLHSSAGASGLGAFAAPAALPLTWTGRFDPGALPGAALGWQLTRLSGRFTGPRLGLEFGVVNERNLVAVIVDGRSLVLEVNEDSERLFTIAGLGEGDHRLEIVKRSEGLFGTAVLVELALAPGELWREAPARPPFRLEVYGDSISAGACNEDGVIDQYESLLTHNPLLSYPAIAARRLNAEIVSVAVSGTGLTCSWNPILMPVVWDRAAPSPTSPRVAPDRQPHVVVVNLGQNDYGLPQSEGRPFDPDYGPRLTALVQGLRGRYPEAWIVGALGGMTGWKECEPLRRLWSKAWDDGAAIDPRVRSFFFQASSPAHPRVDVHALLAEELTAFLTREVWPHLETSPH